MQKPKYVNVKLDPDSGRKLKNVAFKNDCSITEFVKVLINKAIQNEN